MPLCPPLSRFFKSKSAVFWVPLALCAVFLIEEVQTKRWGRGKALRGTVTASTLITRRSTLPTGCRWSPHHQRPSRRNGLHNTLIFATTSGLIGGSTTGTIARDFANGDKSLERLVQSVISQGGNIHGVKVAQTELGRGLVATRTLKRGTTVISTPLTLCPNPMAISTHPDLRGLDMPLRDMGYGEDYILALMIEYETHNLNSTNKSEFAPYVSVLPTPPLPVLLGERHLKMLENTYHGDQVQRLSRAINMSYEKIFVSGVFKSHSHLFSPKFTTLKSWSASLAKVWSRSYNLYKDSRQIGDDLTWAMVPLADLVNHDHRVENNYIQDFDTTPPSFLLRLQSDMKEGEQVFITYGSHTSLQYYMFYGFVLPENKLDFVTLTLPTSCQSTTTKLKKQKIPLTSVEVNTTGVVPLRLLARAANEIAPASSLREGVSVAAERVSEILKRRVKNLPSSLEEDRETLKSPDIDDPSRVILTLRINHKSILQNTIRYLDEIVASPPSIEDIERSIHSGMSTDPPSLREYGLPIDEIFLDLQEMSNIS
ncbi:hypothetical protein AAMO2058_000976300 [Amorphochlora amoebiformis]